MSLRIRPLRILDYIRETILFPAAGFVKTLCQQFGTDSYTTTLCLLALEYTLMYALQMGGDSGCAFVYLFVWLMIWDYCQTKRTISDAARSDATRCDTMKSDTARELLRKMAHHLRSDEDMFTFLYREAENFGIKEQEVCDWLQSAIRNENSQERFELEDEVNELIAAALERKVRVRAAMLELHIV
jgi:hypothetical protein